MRASTILRNLTLVASIALSCSCTKNSSQRANEIAAEHLKELSSEVRLHPADEGALRELIATMDDTNKTAFERQYACTELGSLGALARDSIPALIKALNSTDRVLEREAAIALGNVGVGIDDA